MDANEDDFFLEDDSQKEEKIETVSEEPQQDESWLEEDYEEGEGSTDIPFTMTSRTNEVVHLQLDGKIQTKRFKEALEAAKIACGKILDLQTKALKGEVVDENKKEGGKK